MVSAMTDAPRGRISKSRVRAPPGSACGERASNGKERKVVKRFQLLWLTLHGGLLRRKAQSASDRAVNL